MAPRKFRLGRLPKGYDKRSLKGVVGRPKKKGMNYSTDAESTVTSSDSDTRSSSFPSSSSVDSSREVSSECDLHMSNSTHLNTSTELSSDLNMSTVITPPSEQHEDSHSSCPNTWSESLVNQLHLPNKQWIAQVISSESLGICKLSSNSVKSITVTFCVAITPDYHWTLTAYGKVVDRAGCYALQNIPEQLSMDQLQCLLSVLDTCTVCTGHPEPHFVRMAESRKGKLFSKDGKKIVAILDTCSGEKTIRSSLCGLVVKGKKCSACVSYRSTLRKSFHRWQKKRSVSSPQHQSPSSRTNFRFLNTPQKSKRYSRLRARHDVKSKTIERLKVSVSTLV